jgi:hypothetical protein
MRGPVDTALLNGSKRGTSSRAEPQPKPISYSLLKILSRRLRNETSSSQPEHLVRLHDLHQDPQAQRVLSPQIELMSQVSAASPAKITKHPAPRVYLRHPAKSTTFPSSPSASPLLLLGAHARRRARGTLGSFHLRLAPPAYPSDCIGHSAGCALYAHAREHDRELLPPILRLPSLRLILSDDCETCSTPTRLFASPVILNFFLLHNRQLFGGGGGRK